MKLTNDPGYLWFFSGGLTDQGVEIKVTDTKTGAVRTYTNIRGRPFDAIQGTSAFATCP